MWREKGTKSLVDKVSTAVVSTKKIRVKFTTKKKDWLADFGHMKTSFLCPITHAIGIVDFPWEDQCE